MNLSIKSLLNTSLITTEQISVDCNIQYDDIRNLTADSSLIDNSSRIIQNKLYKYYKLHKQTLLPMHTFLLIQDKFDIYNEDADEIFLDFFETKQEVYGAMGKNHFKFITGEDLEHQSTPFFLLNYLEEYRVYHIKDFEVLIKHLDKIKPSSSI